MSPPVPRPSFAPSFLDRRRRANTWRKLPTPKPFADGRARLSDGRELGFGRFGRLGGDPVFWFHGTPGGRCQLPPDAPEVCRELGFELITVERPGIGESTHHPERSLTSFAHDVAELANALGHRRFATIGLSGGGPYVLSCAHELPERVVLGVSLGGVGPVFGCPGAPGYVGITPRLMRIVDRLRAPLGAAISLVLRPGRSFASGGFDLYVRFGPQEDRVIFERPEIKAMFCRDITAAVRLASYGPVFDIALFARPWPFRPQDIRVPILFFHGTTDTIVPASHSQHLARLVPGAKLEIIEGMGHFAGFMSAPQVFRAMRTLWDQTEGRAVPALGAGAAPEPSAG